MPKTLEIFLDPDTTAAVEALWSRLDDAHVPSLATRSPARHRPHISVTNVADTLPITPALIGAAEAMLGTPVRLPALGIFAGLESVLYLAVAANQPLLDGHARLHREIGDHYAGVWEYYLPGRWVPHATLAMQLDGPTLSRAVGLLHPYTELRAEIASVGLVDFETGKISLLAEA